MRYEGKKALIPRIRLYIVSYYEIYCIFSRCGGGIWYIELSPRIVNTCQKQH